MRKLIVLLLVLVLFLGFWNLFTRSPFSLWHPSNPNPSQPKEVVRVVTEESVTINDVKKVGPSVVTVVEEPSAQSPQPLDLGPFSIFGIVPPQQQQASSIGSGFIVSSDGLVITNKHVVADVVGKFDVVTSDGKKFIVAKISRDPLNDLAILKINPGDNPGVQLQPVSMGDSSQLQVGQYVIAIGTALGEFRNTVTRGVISGLGRGITAGDQFQGYVEREGAYVQQIVASSPADKGGIKQGDIIIKVDDSRISKEDKDLSVIIAQKKVGDTLTISVWRNGNTQDIKVTLASAPSE
jgi:S1-C subfamily serine protease